MGAFISYGDVGVWANNRERDAFLDWFAGNRCSPGDARWEYCKSEAQRWSGRCIDLVDLLPPGHRLELTPEESALAAEQFWPHVGQLLGIIDAVTRGEWHLRVDGQAAVDWRSAEPGAAADGGARLVSGTSSSLWPPPRLSGVVRRRSVHHFNK